MNRDHQEKCPYCSSPGRVQFRTADRTYFKCAACTLLFRGSLKELGGAIRDYFSAKYFDDQAWDQLNGYRNTTFSEAIIKIEKQSTRGRLLDVGCGCGQFLAMARARGWAVEGIDPSAKSIAYMEKCLGNVGFVGTLGEFKADSQYDVITMINVLDLVLEPWRDIDRVASLLKPGGLIYMRVSNATFHTRVFRLLCALRLRRLASRIVIFHQYGFSPAFIRRLLSDRNFASVAVFNARPTELIDAKGHFSRRANRSIKDAIWAVVRFADRISGGKALWAPSLEIMARKADVR